MVRFAGYRKKDRGPEEGRTNQGSHKDVVAAMEAVARAPGLVLVVLVALLLLLPALGLVALAALAQARVSSNGSGGNVSGQSASGGSVPKRSISPSRR